jgi:hypothetical protein
VADVPDFGGILTDAYTAGLQTVLWASAGLVVVVLALVLVFVRERRAD